ncbi:MAG: nucleotidyltransferase domain-containing protein [Nanoarchaeota archaeon]|nr:nucleotidyltransferase domain-containing protein [Nanoarchaeota archaeon]
MAKKKKNNNNLDELYGKDYETALKFAEKIFPEFNSVIKSIVYFGSSSRKKEHAGDIDVLVIFNDASVISDKKFKIYFQQQINESIKAVSEKLHVNAVTLTVFFENLINGEPVVMNIIRDGVSLIDTGFFAPLKVLLLKGSLRPSAEAILNSAARVGIHMTRSKLNLLSAFQELYLGMLDASQATLMAYGVVAPSPEKVPELLKGIKVEASLAKIFSDMQKIFKNIEHRELMKITGKDYDAYLKKAEKFNNAMEKKLKKKI